MKDTLLSRLVEREGSDPGRQNRGDRERRDNVELLKEELYAVLPPEEIATLLVRDAELARAEVEEVLRRSATIGTTRITDRNERALVVRLAVSEVLGLGAIDHLLEDESVSEIMVNGPWKIFFERKGQLLLSPDSYASEEQLRVVIDRIISPLGRRIDEQNPLVNGRLPEGHRVNAIIPPLSLDGSALTIRKFRKEVFSLGELTRLGCVDDRVAQLLTWAVAAQCNIAVSGGTGSGKTTLLNALSLEISPGERIITIEDSAELKFYTHPHVVRLEARPANLEGKGEVSIRDLVINSLRMRPNRIVVGEVRGAEALEMLQAMNTGHDGSLTTLHANSSREVITRLITMVGYGADLPIRHVEAQITSALDLIVHIERGSDGVRRVVEVVELTKVGKPLEHNLMRGERKKERGSTPMQRSISGTELELRTIYRFEQTGTKSDGRVVGHSQFCAPPAFLDELFARGLATEAELVQWRAAVSTGSEAVTEPDTEVKVGA